MGGKKKQTVGYRYLSGVHMVFCHGPVDRLVKLIYGGKTAWRGNRSSGQITINAPELFGGDSSEGGISGNVDICQGGIGQTRNDYLLGQLGALCSSFRGVFGLVFRKAYWGTSPYLKTLAAKCTRILSTSDGSPQWYPEKAVISDWAGYSSLDVDWRMVASGPTVGNNGYPTNGVPSKVTTFTSEDGLPRTVTVQVYGDMELRSYPGGVSVSEHVTLGGTPGVSAGFNVYKMEISSPPAVYYLNTGSSQRFLTHIDETFSVTINSGATVTLSCSTEDGVMIGAVQTCVTGVIGDTDQQDMNPAHIIREALTDKQWGLGISPLKIDDAAFTACADTLYAEKFGLSVLWDTQATVEEFINDIVAHIDARIFVNPSTGKYTLKLIRDDYVIDDLLVLDSESISSVSDYIRPLFGELTNSVTVTYWDATTESDSTLSVDDPAMIQMQGGVINVAREYPAITNSTNASRVAQRDLKAISSPLLSCTLSCNRKAADLLPGDPFILDWPVEGVTTGQVVMRVVSVESGDGRSNDVVTKAVEDVFATPSAGVVGGDTNDWENPSEQPVGTSVPVAVEAPYWELTQRLGEDEADRRIAANPYGGLLLVSGPRADNSINAIVYTDGTEWRTHADYSPSSTVGADFGPLTTEITLSEPFDFMPEIGSHVQVGNELMRFDGISTDGKMMVGRGVLDTVPTSHIAGETVIGWDAYAVTDEVERSAGDDVAVQIKPRNNSKVAPISAPVHVVFNQRAIRPYPPGNFKINGAAYPEIVSGANINFTWAHRDRTQQTAGELIDTTYGSIGPETGTTYLLRIYNHLNIKVEEELYIIGNSFSWPNPGPEAGGGGTEAAPRALAFTKVRDADHFNVLPADLTDLVETFSSDVGQVTHYSLSNGGSYSITGGGFVVSYISDGTNRNDLGSINTVNITMPVAWVETEVTITGSAPTGYSNGGAGIVKDQNNFVMAVAEKEQSAVRIEARFAGASTLFIAEVQKSIPSSFKIALAMVCNSMTAFMDIGSGWEYITGAAISTYDFRAVGNLTGWHPGVFSASRNGVVSWRFDNVKFGRHGGVGIRDMTIVTNEDGSPYLPTSNTTLFTATIPDARDQAYAGVFELNMDDYSYRQVGALMVERGGKLYNDLVPHIIYYPSGNRRVTIGTWGNGFGGSIEVLHKLETSQELLSGTKIISGMTQLNLPKSGSAPGCYDPMLVYDSGNSRWLIAYAMTQRTDFSGSPFYAAAAYSTDLTTWTSIGIDSETGYEGTKIVKAAGDYWIMAGGPAGMSNSSRVFDSAMTYVGPLTAVFEGSTDTQPHPMVFPYESRQVLLTFDNTKYASRDFTWGNLLVYEAARYIGGSSYYTVFLESRIDDLVSYQYHEWRFAVASV